MAVKSKLTCTTCSENNRSRVPNGAQIRPPTLDAFVDNTGVSLIERERHDSIASIMLCGQPALYGKAVCIGI